MARLTKLEKGIITAIKKAARKAKTLRQFKKAIDKIKVQTEKN